MYSGLSGQLWILNREDNGKLYTILGEVIMNKKSAIVAMILGMMFSVNAIKVNGAELTVDGSILEIHVKQQNILVWIP